MSAGVRVDDLSVVAVSVKKKSTNSSILATDDSLNFFGTFTVIEP